MEISAKLFSFCSLLMAALFAYSASVQLNDPDWYFWFPLYGCACVVNLVVTEEFFSGKAGFWSLDLSERLVREKTGSGLVVSSMILQLKASSVPKHPMPRNKNLLPRHIGYGMVMVVTFSFGLPFVFFVIQNRHLKFNNLKEYKA